MNLAIHKWPLNKRLLLLFFFYELPIFAIQKFCKYANQLYRFITSFLGFFWGKIINNSFKNSHAYTPTVRICGKTPLRVLPNSFLLWDQIIR